MKKPNILWVWADQWSFWTTGYAGNRDVATPHLDAFAAQSVNCRHAISATPCCTPARATLLTALRPDRHGLFINDAPLDPDLLSLGKHFRAAGYQTAWIGKWHVDGHGRYSYVPPERRHGFETFLALECTHDYNHSRFYANDDPTQRLWPGYDAWAQTDAMIEWLEARDASQPFLACLSWGPPHDPYTSAPPEFQAQYDPKALSLRPNVPAANADGSRNSLAGYYSHCGALDAAFGRLMAALERLNLSGETIVVFTSDHGNLLGSHGLYDKQGPWDESLRVPFLVRAPGLAPATNDTIIEITDCWPTLCGLSGVEAPVNVQGRDLSRHLRDNTVPSNNIGFYGSYCAFGNWRRQNENVKPTYRAREARGVRTTSALYVEDLNGPWLLHDTDSDPYQMENLVGQRPALQREMAALLRAQLAQNEDEFLPGGEYIARWGYEVNHTNTIPIADWKG